jgi:menaquinone-dependent protoporphyrinogen oxidase
MKTIIIYASKHGSAEKCSELLKGKLHGEVTIVNIKKEATPDITSFDNIIVGGSIYMGKIQKTVSEFCLKNLNELKNKRIGLFICCMNIKEAEMQLNNSFPKELVSIAATKECFGGEFNLKEMNFMEKAITKMVSKMLAKNDPSLATKDIKKDVSMISEENINKFAEIMNNI